MTQISRIERRGRGFALCRDGRYSRQRPCCIIYLIHNGGTDEGLTRCWALLFVSPRVSSSTASKYLRFGRQIFSQAPPRRTDRGLMRNRRNPRNQRRV